MEDTIFYPGRVKSFNLQSPQSVRLPTKVCCLLIRSDWNRAEMNILASTMYAMNKGFVRGIDSIFWNYKHHEECRADRFHHFRPSEWWTHIYRRSKDGGTLWIFGWDIWAYWCLLNGRKEVDEHRIKLDIAPDDALPIEAGERIRKGSGLFLVENPPTVISLAVPGGGRLKFVDLRNYGIEPNTMPTFNGATTVDNVREAVVGYRKLITDYDMGTWQVTSASQAWYCFRRSHLRHKVQINPLKGCLDLEQAAYYGGRCEVKKLGKFNHLTYHIDTNSMYTALAALYEFPIRHACSVASPSIEDAQNALKQYIGCADVTVTTSLPCFPACEHVIENPDSPPKRSIRERLIFPTGTFRTALCGPELEHAVSNFPCKIHHLQLYEKATLLQKWSIWALQARAKVKQGNLKHMADCFKKIINCLPGKFGQRQKQWLPCQEKKTKKELKEEEGLWIQEWGEHPVHGDLTQYRTIANNTEYLDNEFLGALACPIISAVWTAYGRMFLWFAMELVGFHNCLYWDTDSLMLNQDGFHRASLAGMISETEPLKWKIREQASDGHIYGIRRYRFGKRFCVAGPFGKEYTGKGEPVSWTEHQNFTNQMQHGNACESISVQRQAKLQQCYRHGIVDKEGIVHPFQAGQLNDLTFPPIAEKKLPWQK